MTEGIEQRSLSLAKGGIYKDQLIETHSKVTQQISEKIIELRPDFDGIHGKLLSTAAYLHDLGKEVEGKYKGNHKLEFDRCISILESRGVSEYREVVAHLILRHHYTSKQDVFELKDINLPSNINEELILRNLKVSDNLASIDSINLAELDRISNLAEPLKLFAYTVSREGIAAGKIMDLVDGELGELGGKAIYYHNGSIFLFPRDFELNIDVVKERVTERIRKYVDDIASNIIGIRLTSAGTVIGSIDEINSGNFSKLVWPTILEQFESKRSRAKTDDDKEKTYRALQKGIHEIFSRFDLKYFQSYKPKVKLYLVKKVLSPIIDKLDKKDDKSLVDKLDKSFIELSYDDLVGVGKAIEKYLIEQENKITDKFQTSLSEDMLDQILSSLTFLGDKPIDVKKFSTEWYERYLKIAREKAIGTDEKQEEFCYICGVSTTMKFVSATTQKVKLAKIFSNRRPALAKGINNVKICPFCLLDVKILDSKIGRDLSETLIVYLERPATVKPPYIEIMETFGNIIPEILLEGSLQNYMSYYLRNTKMLKEGNFEFNPEYSIGTNHFMAMFLDLPKFKSGIQENLLLLTPLLYHLIRNTNFSIRMDISNEMDYKEVNRLLEIPPLGKQYSAEDFYEDFYKNIVYPVNIWIELGGEMGNVIEFTKTFPDKWVFHFAKILQNQDYRRYIPIIKNKYSKVKEMYGMKENEILEKARIVSQRLKRAGFSKYASTRVVDIISTSILEARKANFDDDAVIDYVTDRVIVLSSREIGREIVLKGVSTRDETKEEIIKDVKNLVNELYSQYKIRGFKEFVMLIRYLKDAVHVEFEFGSKEGDEVNE